MKKFEQLRAMEGKRLTIFREDIVGEKSQKDFTHKILYESPKGGIKRITQASYSAFEVGKTGISSRVMYGLINAYRMNPTWIKLGIGEPQLDKVLVKRALNLENLQQPVNVLNDGQVDYSKLPKDKIISLLQGQILKLEATIKDKDYIIKMQTQLLENK